MNRFGAEKLCQPCGALKNLDKILQLRGAGRNLSIKIKWAGRLPRLCSFNSEAWMPDPSFRFAALRAEHYGLHFWLPLVASIYGWHRRSRKRVILGPQCSEAERIVGHPGLDVDEGKAGGDKAPFGGRR
ncbi:MAG: hypothetical protein AB7I34_07245 [Rhizobiaceae bacterium]